jgi:Uma2 family endonuclease
MMVYRKARAILSGLTNELRFPRPEPKGPFMSSATRRNVPRFTPEQYLALERRAEFKSEFDSGLIEAMSGASREHNLITGNVSREIGNQFKNRSCEVYSADMRVWIGPSSQYRYPDVVAVCGEPEFQDGEFDNLLNPTLIVEVLSLSTESKDRSHKFAGYRRLKSLREYVLISQSEVLIEKFVRDGERWIYTALDNLDDTLHLVSIDCNVLLKGIYAKVEFPEPGENDE